MTFKKRLREILEKEYPDYCGGSHTSAEQQILDRVKECMMNEDEIYILLGKFNASIVETNKMSIDEYREWKKSLTKTISQEMLERLEE